MTRRLVAKKLVSIDFAWPFSDVKPRRGVFSFRYGSASQDATLDIQYCNAFERNYEV